MKLRLRSWHLIFPLLIVACNTVSKRAHPILTSADFGGSRNGKVLVRYVTLPDTEFTYYIKKPLLKAIEETRVFSDIELVELESNLTRSDQFNLMAASADLYSENVFKIFPNIENPSLDYTLDIAIRFKRFAQHDAILSLLTLLIYPNRKEYSYDIYFRLLKSGQKTTEWEKISEDFEVFQSIVPRKGSHFQLTWEKEPVINLVKVAIRKYQNQGLLK